MGWGERERAKKLHIWTCYAQNETHPINKWGRKACLKPSLFRVSKILLNENRNISDFGFFYKWTGNVLDKCVFSSASSTNFARLFENFEKFLM